MNYELNIAVFLKEPQERDLSDGLKAGEDDSKNPREEKSGSYTDRVSEIYDDEADDFDEGVKSEFMIFMND